MNSDIDFKNTEKNLDTLRNGLLKIDSSLQVNKSFRYPSHGMRDPAESRIDGLSNFFHATYCGDGRGEAQLESGINQMAAISTTDGSRRPAILIRTSAQKAGSAGTPWHDVYDMDGGRVRYFGDAKVRHMPDPRSANGNKVLLEERQLHSSPRRDERLKSAPLVFFTTDSPGTVTFRGIGVIEGVEIVTQIDPKTKLSFSNYAFDCALVSLAEEGERLDWSWIYERRNSDLGDIEANQRAPRAWREWVDQGSESLPRVRRMVSRLGTASKSEQMPKDNSVEKEVLREVYEFFSSDPNRKTRFEAVAEIVADFVISDSRGHYHQGWITQGSGDHGVDFVGRLDIGSGFSTTSLVVLGQAKCEALTSPTSGTHIARTVARLKRGWIGVYVTTSYFSTSIQKEVSEDRYPLVMIPGLRVAEAIRTIAMRDGISVRELLERIDAKYKQRLANRDPEQVLIA